MVLSEKVLLKKKCVALIRAGTKWLIVRNLKGWFFRILGRRFICIPEEFGEQSQQVLLRL